MVKEYISYKLDDIEIILPKDLLDNCSKIILNSDNTYDLKIKSIQKTNILKDMNKEDLDELFNIDAFRF